MPWWGWLIIVLVAAVAVPIKLKIYKNIIEKKKAKEDNNEDL